MTSSPEPLHDDAEEPATPVRPDPPRSRLYEAAEQYASYESPRQAEQTDANLYAEPDPLADDRALDPRRREPTGALRSLTTFGAAGGGTGPSPFTVGAVTAGAAASTPTVAATPATRSPDAPDDTPAPESRTGDEPGDDAEDLVDVLVTDHREFERIFSELEAGIGDPDRRRDLIDVVIAELSRHSVAEEQYLYPAAREYLPNGNELADHEIGEHAEAERTMKRLMPLDATDPEFDDLVARLIHDIRHHLDEEEGKLFPALRRTVDRGTMVKLGAEVRAAKRRAPTRPHPAAPDRPPLNKVVGPAAAVFDRTADALRDRKTSPDDL